jgi:hypothetical protein
MRSIVVALLGSLRSGAPRIHGELLKLGFTISQRSVARAPTSAWTARQVLEAFLEDSAPRYLLMRNGSTPRP